VLPFNVRFGRYMLRNVLIQELEYRAYYYMMIVSLLISFAADFIILKLAHSEGRESYVGYNQIYSFILFALFVRTSNSLWGASLSFEKQIRNGEFRRYLLQPVKFSQIFAVNALGEKLFTWILLALIFVGLLFLKTEQDLHLPHIYFYPFMILSIALSWSIFYFFVLCAFWLHESAFMISAFNFTTGIFAGSILPLDWLPLTLRKCLLLSPMPYLGHYPISAAMGKVLESDFSYAILRGFLWFAFMVSLNTLMFKKGVRRYESFGG
jgi:ABC-2 type transport system permease protein